MNATSISDMRNSNQQSKGTITSIVFHLCLFALFFVPFLQNKILTPVKEQGGLMVIIGEPDAGMSDTEIGGGDVTTAAKPSSSSDAQDIADVNAKTTVINKPNPNPKPSTTLPKPNTKPVKTPSPPINSPTEDAANQKAAAAAANKKKFSDIISKADKGGNNKSGTQGLPDGDSKGSALSGITKGSGQVGGGLAGRGVEFEPTFSDKSQKTGRIALKVCVDNSGKVKSADFTQKGSNSSDSYLIDLAIKTSKKYRFKSSEITSQCGTITIDFKVQ